MTIHEPSYHTHLDFKILDARDLILKATGHVLDLTDPSKNRLFSVYDCDPDTLSVAEMNSLYLTQLAQHLSTIVIALTDKDPMPLLNHPIWDEAVNKGGACFFVATLPEREDAWCAFLAQHAPKDMQYWLVKSIEGGLVTRERFSNRWSEH
jgi:hypothetical protein